MKEEAWMKSFWRPSLAYAYLIIILFDFLIAPLSWGILQARFNGNVALQWEPLTLAEGGFFHIAMGAILGVAAFTRGQEKIEKIRKEN